MITHSALKEGPAHSTPSIPTPIIRKSVAENSSEMVELLAVELRITLSGLGRYLSDNIRVDNSSTSVGLPFSQTSGSSRLPIVSRVSPAAHCVKGIAPSNLLVRVGEYHVLNTNEAHRHIDRRIKKVVTHRNFDKFTYEYDIALLEMHDAPIKYQPNIIPICLPTSDNSLETSSPSAFPPLTTAWWGRQGL